MATSARKKNGGILSQMIRYYQRQVQSALNKARTDCKQYPLDGSECGLRFYRAEKGCFVLHCLSCRNSEAHQIFYKSFIE